jgi:hypothetical protein
VFAMTFVLLRELPHVLPGSQEVAGPR